ncbi:hypothetical protein OESDEN_12511, partial [Oesophagostomum dentatum]
MGGVPDDDDRALSSAVREPQIAMALTVITVDPRPLSMPHAGFTKMPLPDTYEDRLWITKILDHMTYEEAFLRRHEIPFRPYPKDRTANIHCNWVFLVRSHKFQ